MALPSILDVPVIPQEDDYTCTPACIKMLLEFVRNTHSGYVPDMNVDEIAKIIGTDELGTPLDQVEKINESLIKAVPSIEFKSELNCSFIEIENEIQSEKPVIAWIKKPHSHSVVVKGLDKNKLIVFINDPESESKHITMQMGKFIDAWARNSNILIKIKIGERMQRVMPEYTQDTEASEKV